MSRTRQDRRRRRGLAALAIAAGALRARPHRARLRPDAAHRAPSVSRPPPEVTPQSDAAVPAREVVMLGSSPAGGAGGDVGHRQGRRPEPGDVGDRPLHAPEAGWTLAPPMLDGRGQPLSGFAAAESRARRLDHAGRQRRAARRSPRARGEAAGRCSCAIPGRPSPKPRAKLRCAEGEHLYDPNSRRAPMVAALEEGGVGGSARRARRERTPAAKRRACCTGARARRWSDRADRNPAASRDRRRLPGARDRRELARRTPGCSRSCEARSSAVALFRREERRRRRGLAAGGSRARGTGRRAAAGPAAAGEHAATRSPEASRRPIEPQLLTVTGAGRLDRRRALGRRSADHDVLQARRRRPAARCWRAGARRRPAPACTHALAEALPTGRVAQLRLGELLDASANA